MERHEGRGLGWSLDTPADLTTSKVLAAALPVTRYPYPSGRICGVHNHRDLALLHVSARVERFARLRTFTRYCGDITRELRPVFTCEIAFQRQNSLKFTRELARNSFSRFEGVLVWRETCEIWRDYACRFRRQ